MPQRKTVCYVAAHSGGHIIPCLTVAQRQNQKNTILFFTSNKPLDTKLLQQSKIPIQHHILPITQKRSGIAQLILPFALIISFVKSFFQLLAVLPERIITTGTIAAIPVCVAGWLLGIPIELFELNAVPGKTISLLAPLATTIHHCFESTAQYFPRNSCKLTAYPVRFAGSKQESFSTPIFSPNRITLFAQGGSQGSTEINDLMMSFIESMHYPIQIIHQAGKQENQIKELYAKHNIPAHVFSYEHNLAPFYNRADIVLCRAGAGSLFEAIFFQKKCIAFPLRAQALNHQLHNAYQMQKLYPNQIFVAEKPEEVLAQLHFLLKQNVFRIEKERELFILK